jgi:ribosomal protein L31
MNGSRDYEQKNQSISSELVNVLKIGIYLSLMSVILLFTLIIYDTSIEVQQVVVVVIGLLLLSSFTVFKQVIDFDHKSSLSDQYIPYFDNRIITSNTVYNGHTYYNNKQNLADAAEEIQNLLNKLSKTYDESPVDKSTLDVNLLQKIEEIETENHEKFTDKDKVITVQFVEKIEKDTSFKQRLLRFKEIVGNQALQELLISHPLYKTVIAFLDEFNDSHTEEEINQTNL